MTTEDEPRVVRRLADLVTFVAEAAFVTDRGWEAYAADTPEGALLRNAGERILIKVATVVEKLPSSYTDQHPNVPWRRITRMRNLVAHHYDKVNDDLVWQALASLLPELVAELGLE